MDKKKPSPQTTKLSGTEIKPDKKKPYPKEINGYTDLDLPEPTRYNDWEVKGRCSDF